jgi:hypothetical protein
VSVTGLSFTPAADLRYIIEGFFLMRTATATIGPRPGVSWPTVADGAVQVDAASSATARILLNDDAGGSVSAANTGLPTTTTSWPATIWGTVISGANPSGVFQITLTSESAGTQVTLKAGSWIRFRTF